MSLTAAPTLTYKRPNDSLRLSPEHVASVYIPDRQLTTGRPVRYRHAHARRTPTHGAAGAPESASTTNCALSRWGQLPSSARAICCLWTSARRDARTHSDVMWCERRNLHRLQRQSITNDSQLLASSPARLAPSEHWHATPAKLLKQCLLSCRTAHTSRFQLIFKASGHCPGD